MQDYNELEYEELKQLHVDIGQLLKDKKHEAIEKLRTQMENIGITVADLAAPQKPTGRKKYQDPDNPENTYAGKGPKPQWLKIAIDEGAKLEDFAV